MTYLEIFGGAHFQVHQNGVPTAEGKPQWCVNNGNGGVIATCQNRDVADWVAACAIAAIANESK